MRNSRVSFRHSALRTVAVLLWILPSALGGQQLQIHHLDVDQGDATLFVLPNGRTMLVDAGQDGMGSRVTHYLDSLGVSTLDAFVLTHYDADHHGGVDKLLEAGVSVTSWYDRGGWTFLPPAKFNQAQFRQYREAAASPTRLDPGAVIELDPTVTITAVASNGHVRGAIGRYPFPSEENAYSVALLVSHNGFNYFVGGDLTDEVEERLVREAALGDLDVYRVSHHGSNTSSSPSFLASVRPEVAVISNGSHCGYLHPREAVLDDLRAIEGIQIFQTNKILCDDPRAGNAPDDHIGDLEEVDADGAVVIEVGESTYDVWVPSTDFRATLPIQGS